MAEVGVIASIVQIADIGLRLSIKLYTFGEIVSTADKSVISISKDVFLTSSVLKELGNILKEDLQSRICSENAIHTADDIVKECMGVFEEMESILVKKLPQLGCNEKEKAKRAKVLLERLRWPYLQPKLELMRSNLERLKSTLNLMLNVITLARQQANRKEYPEVIANQRTLVEDLATSNDLYVKRFEQMKLSIDANLSTDVTEDNASLPKPLPKSYLAQSTGGGIFMDTSFNPDQSTREFVGAIAATEAPNQYTNDCILKTLLEHYHCLMGKLIQEVYAPEHNIPVESRSRIRDDVIKSHSREIWLADMDHKRRQLKYICGPTTQYQTSLHDDATPTVAPYDVNSQRASFTESLDNFGPYSLSSQAQAFTPSAAMAERVTQLRSSHGNQMQEPTKGIKEQGHALNPLSQRVRSSQGQLAQAFAPPTSTAERVDQSRSSYGSQMQRMHQYHNQQNQLQRAQAQYQQQQSIQMHRLRPNQVQVAQIQHGQVSIPRPSQMPQNQMRSIAQAATPTDMRRERKVISPTASVSKLKTARYQRSAQQNFTQELWAKDDNNRGQVQRARSRELANHGPPSREETRKRKAPAVSLDDSDYTGSWGNFMSERRPFDDFDSAEMDPLTPLFSAYCHRPSDTAYRSANMNQFQSTENQRVQQSQPLRNGRPFQLDDHHCDSSAAGRSPSTRQTMSYHIEDMISDSGKKVDGNVVDKLISLWTL